MEAKTIPNKLKWGQIKLTLLEAYVIALPNFNRMFSAHEM